MCIKGNFRSMALVNTSYYFLHHFCIFLSFLIACWRVLPLGQNVITGCQVCLDTDGILCTNTSPQTAHRDQINNYAPGKHFRANKLNIKLRRLRLISQFSALQCVRMSISPLSEYSKTWELTMDIFHLVVMDAQLIAFSILRCPLVLVRQYVVD